MIPRRQVRAILLALATAVSLLVTAGGGVGQNEAYFAELTGQLEVATSHLDEASAAIGDCNDDFLGCLRDPGPTSDRLNASAIGLEGVRSNLTELAAPSQFNSSHQLLTSGFHRVADGFVLYGESLRERDLDKLDLAAEEIRSGKLEIETASASILGQTSRGLDLVLVLTIAVLATAASVGVLMVVLLREGVRTQRSGKKRLGTCPKCGEVLDQYWTFRKGQIEEWRRNHLKSHVQEPVSTQRPKPD